MARWVDGETIRSNHWLERLRSPTVWRAFRHAWAHSAACSAKICRVASGPAVPSTDTSVLGRVPAGTTVTALGANGDGSWVVVEYEGKYGWLAAQYLNAA